MTTIGSKKHPKEFDATRHETTQLPLGVDRQVCLLRQIGSNDHYEWVEVKGENKLSTAIGLDKLKLVGKTIKETRSRGQQFVQYC